jgi:hypothetical protein
MKDCKQQTLIETFVCSSTNTGNILGLEEERVFETVLLLMVLMG